MRATASFPDAAVQLWYILMWERGAGAFVETANVAFGVMPLVDWRPADQAKFVANLGVMWKAPLA